jgi:hypothetical protein
VTEKPPKPAASAKEKRLAEALRANLKRRKEGSRGSAGKDGDKE